MTTTKRTYGDACAAARALDLVGERWALLVVRELLLGPKRFTDLRAGMPGASQNVLAQRLRELEQVEVVQRRKLGPPVSAWVYELTDWGRELEPVLVHLGRWGRGYPLRDTDTEMSVDSAMLALRAHFNPASSGGLNATYELRLDSDRFSVGVADGELQIQRGETPRPDAVVETDAKTFMAVLAKRQTLDEAIGAGRLKLTGDTHAFERLLSAS